MRAQVVYFDRVNMGDLQSFVNFLHDFAGRRNMNLGHKPREMIDGTRAAQNGGEAVVRLLKERIGRDTDLVLCVMGSKTAENAAELYPAIKRWSHGESGIATQCVQSGKALFGKTKNNPQCADQLEPARPRACAWAWAVCTGGVHPLTRARMA